MALWTNSITYTKGFEKLESTLFFHLWLKYKPGPLLKLILVLQFTSVGLSCFAYFLCFAYAAFLHMHLNIRCLFLRLPLSFLISLQLSSSRIIPFYISWLLWLTSSLNQTIRIAFARLCFWMNKEIIVFSLHSATYTKISPKLN